MQKIIWFKRKKYGWGWTPSVWQGWLVVALYVIACIGEAIKIENNLVGPWYENPFLRIVFFSVSMIFIAIVKSEKNNNV